MKYVFLLMVMLLSLHNFLQSGNKGGLQIAGELAGKLATLEEVKRLIEVAKKTEGDITASLEEILAARQGEGALSATCENLLQRADFLMQFIESAEKKLTTGWAKSSKLASDIVGVKASMLE